MGSLQEIVWAVRMRIWHGWVVERWLDCCEGVL